MAIGAVAWRVVTALLASYGAHLAILVGALVVTTLAMMATSTALLTPRDSASYAFEFAPFNAANYRPDANGTRSTASVLAIVIDRVTGQANATVERVELGGPVEALRSDVVEAARKDEDTLKQRLESRAGGFSFEQDTLAVIGRVSVMTAPGLLAGRQVAQPSGQPPGLPSLPSPGQVLQALVPVANQAPVALGVAQPTPRVQSAVLAATAVPTPPPTRVPTPPTPPAAAVAAPSPPPVPTVPQIVAAPTLPPTPTQAPPPTETPAPTAAPTATPEPSPTAASSPSPAASPTAPPTSTVEPTPTTAPTETPTPAPTETPVPSPTPSPTPPPTATPLPTEAPAPTSTPVPPATNTPVPLTVIIGTNFNGASFIGATNMAPGTSVTRSIIIANGGTAAFTYTVSSSDGGGNSALWTDPANGLQMRIKRGPTLLYDGKIQVSALDVGVTLSPGGTDTLDVTVYLPPTAVNDKQGLTQLVNFTFTATGG